MLIFIDESGDSGFKIKKGSSKFFVIVLVVFKNDFEAEQTATKIKDFKRRFRKTLHFEVKFNKLNKNDRVTFLESIKYCQFRVRAIVIEKEKVNSQRLRTDTKVYYNFFLKQVLEHNNNAIKDAKLRLDGFGERNFKNAVSIYLRHRLNDDMKNRIMNNLKFVDSKSNVLIQLADMIAGSIHRHYQKDKSDWRVYKEIIQDKIEDEWVY